MTYKIEKNVPQDEGKVWPFNKMAIGDSFFVPLDDYTLSGIYAAARRFNCKVKVRAFPNGHRIWLVSKRD